ncbi:MAG: VOC family protein [Pseudomonadota bacterium]
MPIDRETFTATDHIVLAVRDIEEGISNWRDRLGMPLSHRADLDDAGVRQAFFSLQDGTFIELIAPMSDSSPLADLLARRGEGIHVLALRVDDLDSTVARLQDEGVRLSGVGTPQVFVHPSESNGVLVQLWPEDRPHRWRDEPEPDDAGHRG